MNWWSLDRKNVGKKIERHLDYICEDVMEIKWKENLNGMV